MSVINKMLQDLDRRNAAGTESESPARPVKAARAERRGNEWFWRVIAVLVLVSLAWVGWVAYQLQPRPVATEQALRAALQPRTGMVVAAQAQPAPDPVEVKPVEEKRIEEKPAAEEKPVVEEKPVAAPEPSETFKLARAIETPIAERKAQAVKPPAAKPVAKKAPQPEKPVPIKGTVNKRETTQPVGEPGEAQFQRAAAFLRQGRVSEAEEQLRAALQANPAHLGARQAYISLLLEQQRVDAALKLLQDAVAVNPAHPGFALTLARVHAEQRNYTAALDVMDKAGAVAENAEFQSLRGTVLLRLGRHAEAVGAYQRAVQAAQQPGETWTGLGISLEAVGRTADAAQAYHRALGAGRLPKELREYAEARIRALQ